MYSTKNIGSVKDNIIRVYFSYESIKDFNEFYWKLEKYIKSDNTHAFLLKIRRQDGGMGMAGKHRVFNFNKQKRNFCNIT